mgnify:CR=1 FL=1
MNNFMEFDEEKKILKSINLDDFSIENLEEYIQTLTGEINRSQEEIKKRLNTKEEAEKFFK